MHLANNSCSSILLWKRRKYLNKINKSKICIKYSLCVCVIAFGVGEKIRLEWGGIKTRH